ncbi:hypothetical protein [Halostella litorea]|uniref:hypothetical protein n=1 Tax=Halostella litorea TaxID=2528831 RepID=UPI001091D3F5|nr:hypothetical protein [Halostella litorea]
MVSIVENLSTMVSLFSDVATSDPLSAALVAVGALFVVAPSAALAYLTAGAVVDLIIPESLGRAPPRQG